MVTCDGTQASHDLIARLNALASRTATSDQLAGWPPSMCIFARHERPRRVPS